MDDAGLAIIPWCAPRHSSDCRKGGPVQNQKPQDLGTYGVGIFTPTILAAAVGGRADHARSASDIITNDITAAKGAALITALLIIDIGFAVLLADVVSRIRLQVLGFIGCAVGLFLASLSSVAPGGAKTLLVTGRALPDLERVCPRLDLFHRMAAENGALLYTPATKERRPLGPPPPGAFVARLRELGTLPLSVGEVIVATWEPNETAVLEAIRDLGLGLQIIFNKGAVMVLPNGINKSSGLAAALEDLGARCATSCWPRARRSLDPDG